jgi:uncharacterized protein (DUF169 family)
MAEQQIKESLRHIGEYIPFRLPAMSWRFASVPPDNAVMPVKDAWACMFTLVDEVAKGKRLCLSAENPGCSGAAGYLGFKKPARDAGAFLAEKERFKKTVELGRAFYEDIKPLPATDTYAVLERIEDVKDGIVPEVIVLWIDALSLAGLVTLANYDRPTNDNVVIPFASGCQSIWTIPYKEKFAKFPKCVVGTMDPAARTHIQKEVVAFSLPMSRFAELAENTSCSFLQTALWKRAVMRTVE